MKRIVICCDGTWQDEKADYPTNVALIAQAITASEGDVKQIVFYDPGVGTQGGLDHLFGGAFGIGLDRNIIESYRFLIHNYEDGDEIYLFGFSRGSYTVRSLAGLLHWSGLLDRSAMRQIYRAYGIYRLTDDKERAQEALEFRKEVSTEVNITALGCFDTVGALGIPKLHPFLPLADLLDAKYRFHDTKPSPAIGFAFHACAIDERRKVYEQTPMTKDDNAATPDISQRWFIGDHSSVGGGCKIKQPLSNIALLWMIEALKKAGLGLKFDTRQIEGGIQTDPCTELHLDVALVDYLGGLQDRTFGKGDTIHPSVWERYAARKDYRPKTLESVAEKRLEVNGDTGRAPEP
jgi:uncharacterized protein (DUF2235 family)